MQGQNGTISRALHSSEDEDALLVRQAQAGQADALEAIYERYRRPVAATVKRTLGYDASDEDVEDVGQETFLRMLKGLNGFHFESRFSSWLFSIANRECLRFWARRKAKSWLVPCEEPPEGTTGNGHEALILAKMMYKKIVSTMSEKDGKIAGLVVIDGEKKAAVARAEDVPIRRVERAIEEFMSKV